MRASHDVDQEEFQMVQLPEISTEQLQEHLVYKRMSSVVDHPWSKPTRENLSVTFQTKENILALLNHKAFRYYKYVSKYDFSLKHEGRIIGHRYAISICQFELHFHILRNATLPCKKQELKHNLRT